MISSHLRSSRSTAYVGLLASTILALSFTGCSPKAGEQAGGGPRGGGRGGGGGGAAPVLVGHAERKVVPLIIEAVGTVEPIRAAAVRAQITGTLFKINIKEGQDVAAGDLLFEVDPRPFENALKSALAEQQRINVQLETARTQADRYKSLATGSMVSEEQLQQVQNTARALEAQAAASEAAVANARLQLSYCSIRAPIAGRTGNLSIREGDMIRANDVNPLVTINQLSPIYVTFGVAQQHLRTITRYRTEGTLQVQVSSVAGENAQAKGELTFVDNTVDPTTGTIKLKATFKNDDRLLWPGQFAAVAVTLSAPEVLTVPGSAVQTSQTGQHVFVVNSESIAVLRPVTIERTYKEVAVVQSGLTAGETVIIDGQLRVIPNRPVQVKSPNSAAAQEAAANAGEPRAEKASPGSGQRKGKAENKGT